MRKGEERQVQAELRKRGPRDEDADGGLVPIEANRENYLEGSRVVGRDRLQGAADGRS